MFSQLFNRAGVMAPTKKAKELEPIAPRLAELSPQSYIAPQSYMPFSQSFQPQQRRPVTDIYQRQQAAMVPRTQPQMMPEGQAPWMGAKKPNPYTNFAQLFGGGNG